MAYKEDIQITATDQNNINSFAKWNIKLKEYEAELENKKICFIVLVAGDGPKLYIVSKHDSAAVQPMDAVINIDEEEDRAKNGALRYSARNHHLCRLLATKTDSLRP
nr:unnamed protein product [Spirometra erinaceieuropaei]